jgi:hypothetical protein
MEQDRAWNLFALKLAGKATAEEWAELQLMMEHRPEIAAHLQALTNFWHQHSKYDKERIEKAVKKIAEDYAEQNEMPASMKEIVESRGHVKDKKSKQNAVLSMIKKQVKIFFALIAKRTGRHKTESKANSLTG